MQKAISKEITDALMAWFKDHRREMPWRGSDDPYHIWVSEMMLQQTQVATVENYYHKWIKRFPDVFTLAEASLQDILKIWEGLGYYTRARNFHKGAKYIVEHAEDKDSTFPDNYDDWLKVPGVGPYTAAAVSSIAFSYPAAVVDSNVKRVMARLFCMEDNITTQKYHRELFKIMNKGFYAHHPGWVNQAWMELGSLQCTSRPDCTNCPLKTHCCANKNDKIADFPHKVEKKKIPTRYGAAFIIENDNKVLMLCRPEEGFLGGLWEYPGFTLKEPELNYLDKFCEEHHIEIIHEMPEKVRHTYSHFHQELKLYKAELKGKWNSGNWTESREVNEDEQEKLPRSKMAIKIEAIYSKM
ncbi:MAG: A/G-specific adenine glycosylase [Candidatus Marinimicrobia bacterium]|nr:A/G-specific adenine glycosylase [Candidatus Neomarinimicrobiota bacterium]